MNKRLVKYILICISVLVMSNIKIQASSGKLRSDSICQDANGTYYGQHSSDNHWHIAVYHEGGGWYPSGGVVAPNPCDSTTSSQSDTLTTDLNEDTSSSEDEVVSNVQAKQDIVPSNNKPEIEAKKSITLDSEEFSGLKKEDIINLFDIIVYDEGEKIADNQITITPSTISENYVGMKKIKISYEDDGGLVANKTIELTINKSDSDPEIITNIGNNPLEVDESEIPKTMDEFTELVGLEVNDKEDGYIKVDKEDINIDQDNEILTITIKDSAGNVASQEIPYIVVSTEEDSFIGPIITLIVGGLIAFLVIRKKNK